MKVSGLVIMLSILVVLIIGPIYAQTILRSSAHVKEGRAAVEAGDFTRAIEQYRLAVSFRSPLNPYTQAAFDELSSLSASPNVSPENQLLALRELRSALISSHSIYDDFSTTATAWRNTVERALSEKMQGSPPPTIATLPKAQINYYFQLIAQIGFWGWLAAVFVFIWKGFDSQGKLKARCELKRLIPVGAFFLLWCVGLYFA